MDQPKLKREEIGSHQQLCGTVRFGHELPRGGWFSCQLGDGGVIAFSIVATLKFPSPAETKPVI
jgi:hypothetical protein